MPEQTWTTVAIETFHTFSMNASTKMLSSVMYDKVVFDGQTDENYGNYDMATSRFDPWSSGGGHFDARLSDQDYENNHADQAARHAEHWAFMQGFRDNWMTTFQAAAFTVNDKGDGIINPVPGLGIIDVYTFNYVQSGNQSRKIVFRTNDPTAVLFLVQMEAEMRSAVSNRYPDGRIELT